MSLRLRGGAQRRHTMTRIDTETLRQMIDALQTILNVEGHALASQMTIHDVETDRAVTSLDVPYHFAEVRAALRAAIDATGIQPR